MSRLMQIQTLSLTLKTSHFNTLFSNCFCSITKKMNFDVECTVHVFHFWNSFFVCVCVWGWINKSSIIMAQPSPKMRQNALFRVSNLKIFPGEAPCTPPMGGGVAPPIPSPPRASGVCKALKHLIKLLWWLLHFILLLLQNLGRTLHWHAWCKWFDETFTSK